MKTRAPFLYWPILCLGILLAGVAQAQSIDDVAAAMAGIVEEHADIQLELPMSGSNGRLPVQDAPIPPEPLREAQPEPTSRTFSLPDWVGRLIIWIMAGGGAALIIYMLWRERPGLRQADSDEAIGGGLQPLDLTPDRLTFAAAAELADAGRHAEAIHTLLLVCLRELRHKMDLSTALTAREIARDQRLADAARGELASVSAAVERSLFGGRLVGAADYQECLSRSHRFVDALEAKRD